MVPWKRSITLMLLEKRQSSAEGRSRMEDKFKPSTQKEAKARMVKSLLRKEAFDEKKQGTFIFFKMFRLFNSQKAWPASRPRTKGENSLDNKSAQPISGSHSQKKKQ